MKKRIMIISGFSGVGKGTIIKKLFNSTQLKESDLKLWLSVSDTTRAPRKSGGDNYNYINFNEYKMRVKNGFYLESNEYGNQAYGTPLQPVLEALEQSYIVLLEIDYNGMQKVKEFFRGMDVYIDTVFVCEEASELADRLNKRGDSKSEIKKRLSIACSEALHINEYDYIIKNRISEKYKMMNEIDNIISLKDELGNNVNFEFLDLICYEGEKFIILLTETEEHIGEIAILRFESIDGDNLCFVSVEDKYIHDSVFKIFKEQWKEN